MTDELKAIRQSAKTFDLDYNPNDEVEEYLDAQTGDQDISDSADQDPETMPFDAAVKIVEISQDETFVFFREIQEQLRLKFAAESKSFKASQDHRTFHATLAIGIEQVQLLWGERIAEAIARLQRASTEEKRLLGVSVKKVLDAMPVNEETPSNRPLVIDGELISTLGGMNVVAAEFVPRRN